MRYEQVHVCIDETTLANGDTWTIIEPVWSFANIYDGPDEYERSLLQFSHSQRLIFAIFWYFAEVNNGGHSQFYSNSTGIVWKDALEGLTILEVPELANVLQQSADLLGGSPSLDRQLRFEQLQTWQPDFHDLDELFYEAERTADIDQRMIAFIRARPADFYFEGTIRRPILPR